MKVDFSECEFINNELKYYTFYDFCKDCRVIKDNFKKLSHNGKRFYMYYVYANIHMGLKYKNIIWDYLNDFKDEYDLRGSKQFYGD